MLKINNRIIYFLTASVIGCFSFQQPAKPLPRQPLQQTKNSVERSVLFSGARLTEDRWTGGYKISKDNSDNKDIVLYLYESNGIVTSETLKLRYLDFSVTFERDNVTELRVTTSTWDDTVVADFVNSRYTDVIEDAYGRSTHFYLGSHYV